MAYTKTLWKNRLVEKPRTFRFQQNADGTVTLNAEEGQIIEPGTPVNAANLNKIEDTLEAHESQLGDMMKQLENYNSYASSKDANGIYTVIDYKRADGTLYMKSTLSGGTSPKYTADTWQFYDNLGTTIIATKTWTLTYDVDGKVISKVVA